MENAKSKETAAPEDDPNKRQPNKKSRGFKT
jgi:hypothetical protein